MELSARAHLSPRARVAFPWLFSPSVDLGMLLVPLGVTGAAVAIAAATGDASGTSSRAYASWIAGFILGNSTHVILTFLLLYARRDMLRATPRQALVVPLGSLATFAIAGALFAVTTFVAPAWAGLAGAIGVVFSFHHQLSQAKGIWSLYNLRGRSIGLGPPPARERSLQRLFVPLGLLVSALRFFIVERRAGIDVPFHPVMPGVQALLPYASVYVMFVGWAAFSAVVLREVARSNDGEPVHAAKVVYVAAHLFGVALTIASPGWGGVFIASVHGLEYFALTRRMLEPRDAAEGKGLRLVVPAIALAVLPLFVVGLVNAPFAASIGLVAIAPYAWGRVALNGVVMAHYFADAFIYRFKIPEIRAVALRRLGFEGGSRPAPVAAVARAA